MKARIAISLICATLLATRLRGVEVDPRYLPIAGSAWRLALGDIDGDGRNKLVYGAYDGAVACIDPATGRQLWRAPLGGFPFAVAAGDIDGDRRSSPPVPTGKPLPDPIPLKIRFPTSDKLRSGSR